MISAAKNMILVSSADLQEHQNDYDWLDEHIDPLYLQIKNGLNYPPSAIRAIELLNLIMPYALTRHDYKRWEEPLWEAQLHAMELKDVECQIQIWAYFGNLHYQLGRYETASATLEKILEQSTLDATAETLLMARIGVLRTRSIYGTRDIQEFIHETLNAGHQVASYHLLGKLHHALAAAYLHQAETQRALGHGQMALACWFREGNAAEKERAALCLAEICRTASCHDQAGRFLELVRPGSENVYMTGVYHYHVGASLLERTQVLEALPHLEQALRQFKSLDFPYITGAAYHTLALVQTKLLDFDLARENLRRALIIWQELDNVYEQANCVYAWGFLEERAGEREAARDLYEKGIWLTEGLAQTPMLAELCSELEEHLAIVSA